MSCFVVMAGRFYNVRLADCETFGEALERCRLERLKGCVVPLAVFEFPGESVNNVCKAHARAWYRYYPPGALVRQDT